MPQLGLAEVAHDIPGPGIHQREDAHACTREGPHREVQIDDQARKGRLHPAVCQIELGAVHRRLGRADARIELTILPDGILRLPLVALGLLVRGQRRAALGSGDLDRRLRRA